MHMNAVATHGCYAHDQLIGGVDVNSYVKVDRGHLRFAIQTNVI